MRYEQIHIIVVIFFLFCYQNGRAQTIEVSSDLKSQNIGKFIEYWDDLDCDASIEYISGSKDSLSFQSYQEEFFSYFRPNSCPWIHFKLTNKTDTDLQFQVRLDNHRLSRIEWYVYRKNEKVYSNITGDDFPYTDREVEHLDYIFPIEIGVGDTLDCYLFLDRGTSVVFTNIYIETMNHFIQTSAKKNYKIGILIGVSFFFVVVAFVILILFRTKLMLAYFLMVFSMFAFSITSEGLGFQYLWGNGEKFVSRFVSVFFPLLQIFSFVSFGILYYKTKETYPKAHRSLINLFKIIGVLVFVGVPLTLFFKDSGFSYKIITRVLIYILEGVIISAFLISLSISIQEYRRTKNKEFLSFSFVIVVYIFFLTAFFLQTFGVSWGRGILEYSIFPSFIFEMIVLTFIIFRNYRSNLIEKERLEIAYSQNQIKVGHALLEGEELERRRIASDLHDSLGSLLSISKLYLSQLNSEKKENVKEWVEKAHVETQRLSNALMPKPLFSIGLIAAIQDLNETLEARKNVSISLVKNDLVFAYSDFQKINFYRLVNELLEIAISESLAKKMTLQFTEFEDELNIILEDDGKGGLSESFFQREEYEKILTRVEALKGEMHIDSTQGRGSSIVIDFKLR